MKVLRRFVYKGKDDVKMYECSLDRMKDKISTFSKFGDAGHGGITRYSLSPEAIMARNEFIKRMKAIGAEIEIDDVANIYATLPGTDPDAKRIVMAVTMTVYSVLCRLWRCLKQYTRRTSLISILSPL